MVHPTRNDITISMNPSTRWLIPLLSTLLGRDYGVLTLTIILHSVNRRNRVPVINVIGGFVLEDENGALG
jgi:hypothetical protein